MFENMEIFRMAQAMAKHAGARQSVVAQNMANADTPGYVAKDLKPFKDLVGQRDADFAARATRPGHLNAPRNYPELNVISTKTANAAPNGNSVSIEDEMLKAVEIQRQHSRALAIYKTSLDILRTAIGR